MSSDFCVFVSYLKLKVRFPYIYKILPPPRLSSQKVWWPLTWDKHAKINCKRKRKEVSCYCLIRIEIYTHTLAQTNSLCCENMCVRVLFLIISLILVEFLYLSETKREGTKMKIKLRIFLEQTNRWCTDLKKKNDAQSRIYNGEWNDIINNEKW